LSPCRRAPFDWANVQLTPCSSTRFIIFNKNAKIITEHQAEFEQILPHAGWHEQDPETLVECMVECINVAMEKLEWMGWAKSSVKGIGGLPQSRRTSLLTRRNYQSARQRYVGPEKPAILSATLLFGTTQGRTELCERLKRS
jgi:hypothetical protein